MPKLWRNRGAAPGWQVSATSQELESASEVAGEGGSLSPEPGNEGLHVELDKGGP